MKCEHSHADKLSTEEKHTLGGFLSENLAPEPRSHFPHALAAAAPDRPVTRDFDQLFHEFAPYVLRVLPRMGVAQRDVDDVAQEVFLAVHRRLPSFEGRSTHKTWMYGICLRICSNYRKRAHRRHEQLASVPPSRLELQTPDHLLENRRRLEALDAALNELPETQRAVFVLHEIEQLAISEIAAVLACSKFTLYARLYAARRTVQAQLLEHVAEAE